MSGTDHALHRAAQARRSRRRALVGLALALALAVTTIGCGDDPPPEGSTTLGGGVHAIERGPADAPLTVLFLHGAAYTSSVWDRTGILDLVADAGHHAIAVDLPGAGATPALDAADGQDGSTVGPGTWLRSLVDELGGPERTVVVTPSASGRYSLGYLAAHPDEPLAGLVPVAPVGIDAFERPADAAPIPSLIVWGEQDPAFSAEASAALRDQLRSPDSTEVVLAGAGHAAYEDDPDGFTEALLAFLADRPA